MEAILKAKVDELLRRDEPPELEGMSRGYDENGAVRKLSSVAIKYWDAYRDAQIQLIEMEDARDALKRARRRLEVWRTLAICWIGAFVAFALSIRFGWLQ